MSIEKTGNSSLAFAWKQFQERSQVFCANYLSGKSPVQKVQLVGCRVISRWLKGDHRSRSPGRVHEVQGGAEQTGEGLRQGYPFGKCPA